ncbi:MAG TPA: decarboxylating 6-phosphogluconate dehydrogenase [Acidimicrobiales bacterium]|nr:decarboxylating 6-phosphogluconate dehydrogenase [Acidimicrobiales bacterium]
MVGLGKMGANMSERLMGKGHEVVAFDLSAEARAAVAAKGAHTADTLADLVAQLPARRVVWVMVPAGEPTTTTIDALKTLMSAGDVVIDGGNSNYNEAAPTATSLADKGIGFVDAGTSGGVWGLANGYCLMVGGTPESVALCEPAFLALAPEGGYAHVGPVGAGHFVKMVHNGIEYGLMQAYAEGFEIMGQAHEFGLDLHQIASIWRYGSVVRSWLLELAERALAPGSGFEKIEGYVVDSGEGRWTAHEAIARGVPAPVITTSLFQRFASRQTDSLANRLLAALRNQFGGHAVVTEAPAGSPGPAKP